MKIEITRHKSGKMYYAVFLLECYHWIEKGFYDDSATKKEKAEILSDILEFISQYKRNKDKWVLKIQKYPRATTYILKPLV